MICYYLMYRAAIYRHRLLTGNRSHDRFVYHCYYWWLR
jgi:hypothetical protein